MKKVKAIIGLIIYLLIKLFNFYKREISNFVESDWDEWIIKNDQRLAVPFCMTVIVACVTALVVIYFWK